MVPCLQLFREGDWEMLLRDTFDLIDIKGHGSLGLEEVRLLFQEICVPLSPSELQEMFLVLDTDKSGTLELPELLQFFARLEGKERQRLEDDLGEGEGEGKVDLDDPLREARARMRSKLAVLRVQLKTKKLFNEMMGSVYTKLARRAIIHKARTEAIIKGRQDFRSTNPPHFACKKCVRTFAFEMDLRRHWKEGCKNEDLWANAT